MEFCCIIEMNVKETYMLQKTALTNQPSVCPQCVFVCLLTPALPSGTFPLQQQSITKENELSVLHRRWNVLEILWITHFIHTKYSLQMYRETQLRSTFMRALSGTTYLTFSCFSYQWHIGRGPLLARSRLHFSRVPRVEERGRVTTDNSGISLRSSVKTWCLVKQSELLKWPSELLWPGKHGRMRGTVSWSSWY